MYATGNDIAAHLGRPLTTAEVAQVGKWIAWLSADIDRKMQDMYHRIQAAE